LVGMMVLAAALVVGGGCGMSKADLTKHQQQIEATEAQREKALALKARAEAERVEAERLAAELRARDAGLRQQIVAAAQQVAGASPEGMEAIRATLAAALAQQQALAERAEAAVVLSRQWTAKVEEAQGLVEEYDAARAQAIERLEAGAKEAQGAGDAIRAAFGIVGTAAATLAPGVGTVAAPAAEAIGGVLAALMGGTSAAALAYAARKRGGEREAQKLAEIEAGRRAEIEQAAASVVRAIEAAKAAGGGSVAFGDAGAVKVLDSVMSAGGKALVDRVQAGRV
jgi:hypothetical protein